MSVPDEFQAQYREALERFLDGAGEEALAHAYDIGRRAVRGGLGILDVAGVHQAAVAEILKGRQLTEPTTFTRSAVSFLVECLSPFEMSYRSVAEANAALRRLNELLEDEAKRIAHALHDQAGTILATAGLELDIASGELPAEIRERLAGVRRLVDETGEQLRHLSHELRPTILDDLGLLAALEFLAQGVEQRTGVSVRLLGQLQERVPAGIETAVYRIVQEALNNALMHGGDSLAVTVTVERTADTVRCVIADNGVGFDLADIETQQGGRGLGLLGMRERANAVAGSCEIGSAPGRGTTVEVCIPLETPHLIRTVN